jgi:hypothetical protein
VALRQVWLRLNFFQRQKLQQNWVILVISCIGLLHFVGQTHNHRTRLDFLCIRLDFSFAFDLIFVFKMKVTRRGTGGSDSAPPETGWHAVSGALPPPRVFLLSEDNAKTPGGGGGSPSVGLLPPFSPLIRHAGGGLRVLPLSDGCFTLEVAGRPLLSAAGGALVAAAPGTHIRPLEGCSIQL